MGRQIQLYLGARDVEMLEDVITGQLDATLLARWFDRDRIATVSSIVHRDQGGSRSLGYIVRPCDLNSVILQKAPHQDRWFIDDLRSPVIEFDGGFEDDTVVRRGRLYYQKGYYNPEQMWVEKPAAFVSWAEKLLRTTGRLLTRNIYLAAYVGESAVKARAGGRTFSAL